MPRYPAATWRGPIPNQGGYISNPRLGVFHIMEGTLSGTDSWFHNPAANSSAHFGIGKDGTVLQWVDTNTVAWHCSSYNAVAIGLEHEGFTGDTLTTAQVAADQALVLWLHDVCGIVLSCPPSPTNGWVTHGSLGDAGGNHPSCPGAPIAAQMLDIVTGTSTIPPPTARRALNMIASTSTGNGYWTVSHDGAVGAFGDASYHGGGFSPDIMVGECVGICGKGTDGYWLFAADGGVFAFGSAEYYGRPDRF